MKMKGENLMNTRIIPLGGLGEVGKNMYVVACKDEIIIVDSGVMFPDDELLGIDYVIPDYTFLKENEHKIKALVITHGHEDHIGGIPFMVQSINVPKIYAPANAKELIEKKFEERNINYRSLLTYDENTVIKTKYFNIELFKILLKPIFIDFIIPYIELYLTLYFLFIILSKL